MKKSKKTLLVSCMLLTGVLSMSLYIKDNTSKFISIEEIKDNRAMAFYIEKDGIYESTNTFPTSGYKLNEEKSICSNGAKPSMASDYSINITNLNGSTNCYLYFDKLNGLILADEIKKQSKGEKTSFSGIATESDTGVYTAPDDYGTSYYFRGLEGSLNNWVEFAGFYWRIIRINGNGTIRMIYQGEAKGDISSSNKTGTTTMINETLYVFNNALVDNTFVGYMNSINNGDNTTNYEQAHSNLYNSNVKTEIDKWYKTNIIDKGYGNYADNKTGFCNDRSINTGNEIWLTNDTKSGYGKNATAYGPYGRSMKNSSIRNVQLPSLKCINKEIDLFTINTEDIGNHKLKYPVGMITSDEIIFAGSFGHIKNSTHYLYTASKYWTLSPSSYGSSYATVFSIDSFGAIYSERVNTKNGLRPVINLRADIPFSGDGSEVSPYKIVS